MKIWMNIVVASLIIIIHTVNVFGENESQIKGYAFYDQDKDGIMDQTEIRIPNLHIYLWEGHNLLETTTTNEEGLYQFQTELLDKTYQIVMECPQGYTLSLYNEEENGNRFTFNEEGKASSGEFFGTAVFSSYSIGMTELAYQLHYHLNGIPGELIDPKSPYYTNALVDVLKPTQLGYSEYIFQNWNTKKDGSGESYSQEDKMVMPPHNVTLYAIWEKNDVKSEKPQKNQVEKASVHAQKQASLLDVKTSDQTHILILSLMLLASLGGIIVIKALTKKNR